MQVTLTVTREIKTFGEYMRFVRQARFGVTMREISERIGGFSKQYINHVETNAYRPSVQGMAKLCLAYGITAEDIESIGEILKPTKVYVRLFGEDAQKVFAIRVRRALIKLAEAA